MNETGQRRFRIATYLAPSYPVELYHIFQAYLEQVLGKPSFLIVENRWNGPPSNSPNPFTDDEIDIAFLSSTSYLNQQKQGVRHMELLGAAPVHNHPLRQGRPVYFSEVVVKEEDGERIKNFHDLKGHSWVYNFEESLSGSYIVLNELKRLGSDASFFARLVRSGSHKSSLEQVLDGLVDGTSVDSNIHQMFYVQHPEYIGKLHKVCTWGPLPVHPVVVNSRLPDDIKLKIKSAFLRMATIPEWAERLQKFNVCGFQEISHDIYIAEKNIMENVKKMSLDVVYY